jgi:hypothetical protein
LGRLFKGSTDPPQEEFKYLSFGYTKAVSIYSLIDRRVLIWRLAYSLVERRIELWLDSYI